MIAAGDGVVFVVVNEACTHTTTLSQPVSHTVK